MRKSIANALSLVIFSFRLLAAYVVWLFPSNDDIWVFTSHNADTFAENSKYQFLYSSQTEDVRAIWISYDSDIVDMLSENGYEAYTYGTFRGKYFAFRAGYMFFTHSARKFVPYSGNSTTIQLWHGNMLKRMGHDKQEGYNFFRRIYYNNFGRGWDHFLVTSDSYPCQTAKTSYRLNENQLFVAGYPRTDVLYRDVPGANIGIDESVQETFTELSETGTLLCYLPTWNGGRTEETRFSEDKLNLRQIDDSLTDTDATLIIKLHPSAENSIDDASFENIVVVNEGVDMYPLLPHVDALITDFSSIYFDYLLLDRPELFYPYDLESYTDRRGLYFQYDEVTPGPKAFSTEDLSKEMRSIMDGSDEFADEREIVRDEFFTHQDGRACERVHKYVKSLQFQELPC